MLPSTLLTVPIDVFSPPKAPAPGNPPDRAAVLDVAPVRAAAGNDTLAFVELRVFAFSTRTPA
jgi:hypothetical protein